MSGLSSSGVHVVSEKRNTNMMAVRKSQSKYRAQLENWTTYAKELTDMDGEDIFGKIFPSCTTCRGTLESEIVGREVDVKRFINILLTSWFDIQSLKWLLYPFSLANRLSPIWTEQIHHWNQNED